MAVAAEEAELLAEEATESLEGEIERALARSGILRSLHRHALERARGEETPEHIVGDLLQRIRSDLPQHERTALLTRLSSALSR